MLKKLKPYGYKTPTCGNLKPTFVSFKLKHNFIRIYHMTKNPKRTDAFGSDSTSHNSGTEFIKSHKLFSLLSFIFAELAVKK